ncbi:MAG TPA: ATP-binding protein [Herpetosiphonaceae bacterium]
MDVEVFARQVQEAEGRLQGLIQQTQGPPLDAQPVLDMTLAELSTAFEELNVAVEELNAQQQELLASQQLIESERQRYRDLFDFAPDSYLVTDERGVIQEANRAAATLLNIDQPFLPGLPLSVFLPQHESARLFQHLQSLRRAQPGTIEEWEMPIQPRNASPRDAWLRVAPITNHARRVVGLRWLLRDQTAHKLSLAQQQTSAILESISDAFYAVDHEWRFTYVNHKAEQLLGQSREQLLGQNIWEVFPAAMMSDAYTHHQRAMTEQEVVEFEMLSPVLHSWIEGRIYPSAQGVSVYFHDISERKRAEAGLQLLAQASDLLSATLDYETTLVQVAQLAVPALADMCLVSIQEEDGEARRIEVAVAESIPAEHRELVKRLADDGWSRLMARAVRREESILIPDLPRAFREMLEPDSEHRQIARTLNLQSLMVIPLLVREHTVGALVMGYAHDQHAYDQTHLALAADLADRIALAIDNARLYRDAQAAIAARDTFLSMASHELKTPLTALMGYAYLLQHTPREGAAADERARQAADVIARQTQRLNHLIDEMLDLTRIQRGQWDLLLQPVDILPLIERAVDETQLTSASHRIDWTPAYDELIVNGDEGWLEQVIQNLLNNAVKYSPAGGRIAVAVEVEDHIARVSVADQGIGIPQTAQARLWEPFYRAANASKQSRGFGIGLFIVHEIVRRHGGSIAVQSVEHKGSTFTVSLPLLAVE